jgi:hypothetical protein
MSSRWVTRALIVVVLVGIVFWIAQKTYWEDVALPQPLQGEAATNPFYSASHLAASLGARPRWQRVLASTPPPDAVVVASTWNWGLFPERRTRLESWVASGGRLVLDSSLIGGQRELEEWTGISRYMRTPEQISDNDRKIKWEKCPELTGGRPDGASALEERFAVCVLDRVSGLRAGRRTLWLLRDNSNAIQAERVAVGKGSVTLINAAPFGNRTLLDGDHAALLVAATQLRRGDPVWFVTEEKGASLLSLIWSTGAPVVALLLGLIALWLWRSASRFGPPLAVEEPARRSLAEQIRGIGQFTLRFGGGRALYAAQVRALQETADRYIAGYSRLTAEQRMAKLAQRAGVDSSALAAATNVADTPRRGELRQRLTLLESVRRSVGRQS